MRGISHCASSGLTGSYDCEFSWAKSFNQLVSKVDIVLML